MTKVSDVFDSIVTMVKEALPDYVHMPDAYSLVDNSDLALNKGFVVGIGPASKAPTQEFCNEFVIDRAYFVTLSNSYTMRLDTTARNTYEKNLANDMQTVITKILSNTDIAGDGETADFSDGTGPEYLDEDNKRYLVDVSSFVIRYEEPLTL